MKRGSGYWGDLGVKMARGKYIFDLLTLTWAWVVNIRVGFLVFGLGFYFYMRIGL